VKLRVLKLVAFAALSGILTAWIAQSISGGEPGSRYELAAEFNDVVGMRDGDDVKLAGLTVGEVSDIEVVAGRARVRFRVDDEVQLPTDTVVAVRWRNLIGQRYLGLEAGRADTLLGDGDTVAGAKDVVDLGQLVNQLVPLTRAVSPDQVNEILTTLLEAFDGNDAAFDGLLADLDGVLGMLADRESTIDQLLVDYDQVAAAVASRDAQIGQMVDNLVAISGTFADHDALLDQALVELSELMTGFDGLLDRSAGDLAGTIQHLGAVVGTAADNVDTLEHAIQGLPLTFETLLSTLDKGEYLRLSVLCVTVLPGPCPLPTSVSGGPGESPIVFDPGNVITGLLDILWGVAG
jgi:phospholipid/cholesterol/gamma-HCH transport system substrate-binding protein